MKQIAIGLIAAAASVVSFNAAAAGHGIYAGIGTLGANLGYKFGVSESLGLRVGANTFQYSDKIKDGDVEYKGDLTLKSFEVLADWHPFRGGFALTGGFLVNHNRFEGRASGDSLGTITINGVDYSGANARAEVDGHLGRGVTPYVGLGFTANPAGVKGLRFNAGLGVVFQRPDATVRVSGIDDPAGTLEADRAEAERNLQKDLRALRDYPVVTLGLSYGF